ncbi:cell division protein FtsQ/DivIB [Limosilactobacillus reuteri]|uniref:Cell division protein DivIB n=1 Tax=Limosilactobacillus reuteri TaxID=1598 RepID=A0ABD6Y960_LIMRT|nr:FtsQ-type POTRA domain-containing protein [Limosilactobacillus reuteri]PWT38518.1 cell division protein FtsQ [Limosilactobacillus reuteri]
MLDDRSAIEHHKYSQRLTELEKRSAAAQQRQQQRKPSKTHVGNKIRGIKIKRYVSNGERVLKLVVLFSVILLFMLYIISPLSKITTLHVTGNHDLTKEQVEKNTNIYPGRFIWGVYLARHQLTKQAIRKNPQIKDLRIKVTGPQSLQISVKENALLGTAVMDNDTYAVLADGQLQRTKNADNGIAYKRFDGHKNVLATTAAQLGKLKPAIRNGISSVSYQPTKDYPDRVIIYMRDGNTVYGDLNTIGDKMGYYPAIAASMKNKGIIDLQVGAYSYDYGSKDK